MAPKRANAAHIEALGESMTPEETKLMDDNRDGEHAAPAEAEQEAEPVVPEKQPELALEAEEEADKPEIDPQTGKQRVVNYGALHAEREKRRKAEGEASKAREDFAKLSGRIEVLQQLVQKPAQHQAEAPIEIPDVNVDPVGHFKAQLEVANRKIEGFSKWQESQDANNKAMNNVRELTNFALAKEQEFLKTTPDYQEAAQYARSVRDQELQYLGYKDPAERAQYILQDALQIAAQSANNGVNPAEVVYNIAKARGYQAKAPAAEKAALTPKPVAQSPDAQKIATVAKGQQATQSLGQVGGQAVPDLSPESILKMSDSEFAKWASDDNWRKLMGG